jgi:hypothetical protein
MSKRDGYRDILQICHPGQTEVTIGQIEQVLTEEVRGPRFSSSSSYSQLSLLYSVDSLDFNSTMFCSILHQQHIHTKKNSVTWRAIKNLVNTGKIPELADLSPEKAASVLFAGVYGIGPGKAKDLYVTIYLSLSVNVFPSPFADRLRQWDFGLPLCGV